MACGKCGAPNDAAARFCNRCGTPLSPSARAETEGRPIPLLFALVCLLLVALVGIGGYLGYGLLVQSMATGTANPRPAVRMPPAELPPAEGADTPDAQFVAPPDAGPAAPGAPGPKRAKTAAPRAQ